MLESFQLNTLFHTPDIVIDFTLLGNPLFVDQPQELIGWVGWLFLLSILILLLFHWRKLNKHWTRLHRGIFIGILVLLFLTNLLFAVSLPVIGNIFSSDQAVILSEMAIPIFDATPWVLAAGLLGIFPAVGVGILSGIMLALLDTHSPFTPLEY